MSTLWLLFRLSDIVPRTSSEGEHLAAPTVTPTETEAAPAAEEAPSIGAAATWWYDWVNAHRVGAIALVGVIATQIGTYFGYVFPAIGLPQLPWPAFNGVLATPGEAFDTAGGVFVGPGHPFTQRIFFSPLFRL